MATGLTPNYLIPYPLSTDPVDVHGDVQDLADRLDDVLEAKANISLSNTFVATNVFEVNSSTTAVRITQTGSGDSLRVEDAANPDATPFIINNAGNVGIGVPSPTEKIDILGNENLTGLLFVGQNARTQYQSIGANTKTATFKQYDDYTQLATITTSASHGFFPGQSVTVSLTPTDALFNGLVEVIDVPTSTTFTYEVVGGTLTALTATGGTVIAVPGFTNPIAIFTSNSTDYAQVVVQNINSSTQSSTDVIAYANNGNDYHGWIDMGITSSGFSDPSFTITGENDGYIFMSAPYGTTGSGNLVLATDGTGTENKIVFAAGGLSTDNTQMEITPDVNVHIEIPTPSTSASTGALTVVGGVGVQGDVFIDGGFNVLQQSFFGLAASAFETSANLTSAIAVFSIDGPVSSFSQVAFRNAEPTSSTDLIVYMDNGTDSNGWMDMGIAGSNFDDATYGITSPGDGYIFHNAINNTYLGNMVLATGDEGSENKIVFAAGGFASGNTQMEITPDVNVHIEIPTPSTTYNTGALTVVGGFGIEGDTNTLGYLSVEGTVYGGDAAKAFETSAALTNPRMVVRNTEATTQSSYSQIAFQNADATSSTDFIVYMDNGVDAEGWMDMGICGSTFDDATFGITSPGDGYLFLETKSGSPSPVNKGNMVFATGANGTENKIVFAAGGFASGDTQMEIVPGVNVHIEIPTPSVSATTGALTVVGGVGILGDMNVQGNINAQGTITFGGGGTTVQTSNLAVTDPMIFVGTGNQADIVDLSFIGEYAVTVSTITKTITNKALTSNVATLTTGTAHTFLAGDVAVITGVDATFNGTFNIIAVPTATTFTYAKTATNVASTAVSPVGSVGVSARRKFYGMSRDASDGVVKFFQNATTKPTTTVDFAEAGLTYATIKTGSIDASSLALTTALPISSGGTGQTTATTAINALLPSQTGSAGRLLITDGTNTAWSNTVTANAVGTVGFIVKGLASQSANLQQWQTSTGTVLASMSASGGFTAVTKSFDIEHPTKEDMRLRYASLEGPENGVYVRGTTTSSIIELPDYWLGLVHEDSITVNLTSFGSSQDIYVIEVKDNKVYIGGDLKKAFFTVYGERKDVNKLIVEY